MKDYFVHLFQYNDWANRRILNAAAALAEPEEALYLFTHIVESQQFWMARVQGEDMTGHTWFGPAYDPATCEQAWTQSLQAWLVHLNAIGDGGLMRVVTYLSTEGPTFRSTVQEIVVQLNNHAVHHRAQIARMIRRQGQAPPVTDYIFYTRQSG